MLPEVTYPDYEAWGGSLDEDAFKASLGAATARVRYIIGFNAPDGDDEVAAYKRAVCAATDVDAAYGASGGIGEGGRSLTIGSFSVSDGGFYGTGGNGMSAYDRDMQRAVHSELTGTGLLYQGVG